MGRVRAPITCDRCTQEIEVEHVTLAGREFELCSACLMAAGGALRRFVDRSLNGDALTTDSEQIHIYNVMLRSLMKAYQTLQALEVTGWTPHVLLQDVSDNLWYAWENGMELSYTHVGQEVRDAYQLEAGRTE